MSWIKEEPIIRIAPWLPISMYHILIANGDNTKYEITNGDNPKYQITNGDNTKYQITNGDNKG